MHPHPFEHHYIMPFKVRKAPHVWVLSRFSCVWLFCDPVHCSPPGSSVYGIFQARMLEWVAVSSSSTKAHNHFLFCTFHSSVLIPFLPFFSQQILFCVWGETCIMTSLTLQIFLIAQGLFLFERFFVVQRLNSTFLFTEIMNVEFLSFCTNLPPPSISLLIILFHSLIDNPLGHLYFQSHL